MSINILIQISTPNGPHAFAAHILDRRLTYRILSTLPGLMLARIYPDDIAAHAAALALNRATMEG